MSIPNITPLNYGETDELLGQLGEEWSLNDNQRLTRVFSFSDNLDSARFSDFVSTMALKGDHSYIMNSKTSTTEKELINCIIEIWTESINALTSADFQFARKVESGYRNFA